MPLYTPTSIIIVRGGTFDNMGGIAAGSLSTFIRFPVSGKIIGWSIEAEGSSPTATIDFWKIGTGTAVPTIANSIFSTNPQLITGNAIEISSTAGFNTTNIVAGDIGIVYIQAVSNATKLTFNLKIKQ